MKYHDVTPTANGRFRLPASHPVLATLTIDPAQWYDLQRLNADNEDTHIVGHDDSGDGMMTVYLACSSDEVKRRLEAGWG
jgi:hypothetical protein